MVFFLYVTILLKQSNEEIMSIYCFNKIALNMSNVLKSSWNVNVTYTVSFRDDFQDLPLVDFFPIFSFNYLMMLFYWSSAGCQEINNFFNDKWTKARLRSISVPIISLLRWFASKSLALPERFFRRCLICASHMVFSTDPVALLFKTECIFF